jgi:HAD superfamily hydrolase (TIGR01490 family)
MIIAVFDLDGTLYTGHIGEGIAEHHQTHRTKRLNLALYFSTHYPLWILQKAGLMSDETGRTTWARDMGWLFRGWQPDEADTAFQWITEHYVLPRLRPAVIARLKEHQQKGDRVILLSGTPSPLLAIIARNLGVEDAVGTPLRIRNGRFTGGSENPVCQGANKVLCLESHLGGNEDVQWAESWAYADSLLDLPVLERVGHPVAVCPDPALASLSKDRHWEIIQEEEHFREV